LENEVVLIYPPATIPTSPSSGIAALAGFLISKNVNVKVLDLNAEAYDFWLNKPYCDKIDKNIFNKIHKSKGFFKSESSFYNKESYSLHHQILKDYFIHLSSHYQNISLSLAGYYNSSFDYLNIPFYIENNNDPIKDFLNYYFNTIQFDGSNIVGISVTYDFQFIPALMIAYFIKKYTKVKKVVLGGACIQFIKHFFNAYPSIFNLIDRAFVYEGETAFYTFLQNDRLAPNSIFRDENGNILTTTIYIEDFNTLPIPYYGDLNRSLYLTPILMATINTSRGCYYNKCSFCVPSFGRETGYRMRSVKKVKADIESILNSLHTDLVFFGDDCLNLPYISKVLMISQHFFWQAETRFETILDSKMLDFLKNKGVCQLIFGLESANQRILNLMQKGTQADLFQKIIRACYDHGISVNLQILIGFPTESVEESGDTFSFIIRNKKYVKSIALSQFVLLRESQVFQNQNDYQIRVKTQSKNKNQFKYESFCGLGQNEAELLASSMYSTLKSYFPNNDYFLDGPMGVHALVYSRNSIT
jgi:anaerobic magnesium-protoporphyrin IX monomethyl ester cyclase